MHALAQHTLLEFYECDAKCLKHARDLKTLLRQAVLAGGGTIVKSVFHNFSPYGVSGVIVITESHVTIHTWPEHAYAAVDVFSCSEKLDHKAIRDQLQRSLASKRVTSKMVGRGLNLRKPARTP